MGSEDPPEASSREDALLVGICKAPPGVKGLGIPALVMKPGFRCGGVVGSLANFDCRSTSHILGSHSSDTNCHLH